MRKCQDEETEFWKTRGDKSNSYDRVIKVKLPSIEGFSLHLGVATKTLYNWGDEHPEFLHALEKIKKEQQLRLMDKGLSGEYNSTIAKLILSANHGMREKSDITTDGKELPTPILHGLLSDDGNKKDSSAQ